MARRGLRAELLRIWHSRSKLCAIILFLTIGILLCDRMERQRDASTNRKSYRRPMDDEHPEDNVLADTDYAVEAMEYLRDSSAGKAKIAPIVEVERPLNEQRWFCGLRWPEKIREDRTMGSNGNSTHSWTTTEDFHMFSAYLDERPNSLYPKNKALQVLAMKFRFPASTVYCNLFTRSHKTVVEATVREIWQRAWDPRGNFILPLLITCPIPRWMEEDKDSLSIQVTKQRCKSHQEALRVTVPKHRVPKAKVAVCVKGMDFQEDISLQLIEWVEAQFLFGADTISIYAYTVPPRVRRVLESYAKQGKIELTFIDLPGDDQPHIPIVRSAYIKRNRQQKRRHELIPYNDCLYWHLNSHEYVLIVDTDELVMPLRHRNWKALLEEVENNDPDRKMSSISIRNVFKFPHNTTRMASEEGIGRKRILPMLTHRLRSRQTSRKGDYGKSFSSTANVASVFNHFALHRLSPEVVKSIHLPETAAIKLHYKSSCPIESRNECPDLIADTVEDKSLDPYAEELENRVRHAHKKLGWGV